MCQRPNKKKRKRKKEIPHCEDGSKADLPENTGATRSTARLATESRALCKRLAHLSVRPEPKMGTWIRDGGANVRKDWIKTHEIAPNLLVSPELTCKWESIKGVYHQKKTFLF